MSKIEEAVARRIIERAEEGKRKYGVTMERSDLTLIEWLQHLQEEIMDAAVYLEKIKQEVHYQEVSVADKNINDIMYDDIEVAVYGVQRGPCSSHDEFSEALIKEEEAIAKLRNAENEEAELRMKMIGRNGNDGLHYDTIEYFIAKAAWEAKDAIQQMQQTETRPSYGNDGLHYETRTMYPGDIEVTYTVVKP